MRRFFLRRRVITHLAFGGERKLKETFYLGSTPRNVCERGEGGVKMGAEKEEEEDVCLWRQRVSALCHPNMQKGEGGREGSVSHTLQKSYLSS